MEGQQAGIQNPALQNIGFQTWPLLESAEEYFETNGVQTYASSYKAESMQSL